MADRVCGGRGGDGGQLPVEALPDNYRRFITECGETPERVVCDYIAGMSDQYSVAKFEEIFVPTSWKV